MPASRILLLIPALALAAPDAVQMRRGAQLYAEKCALCHQAEGTGVPPVYPPLAGSDWLLADRARSIRVLCEGLEGAIAVKGQPYVNVMPAQVLDDAQVADVLTFATNSWGNSADAFTAAEVRSARARTRFKSYDALVKAASFQPLPQPPPGWRVREVAQLPELCVRLASRGDASTVYVLAQKGTVYVFDPASSALLPLIRAVDYLGDKPRDLTATGMAQAPDGRLYLVTNERITSGVEFVTNEVTIWRTTAQADGHPIQPRPWFSVRYPWGVGPYNHAVNCLGFGPDGMLYANSGSRTDGGEAGSDPKFFQGGETDITACLWQLDPRAEQPRLDVIARGIRNAWSFAWDGSGQLFTASNGPDADAPEEMDAIAPGRHYGFPFQFSDWPVRPGSPYPHTPPPPAGVEFTLPVRNFGPAGGGSDAKPLATFDAHSSPAGMIWCGDDWPAPLRRSFLVGRFGNLLGAPAAPEDVGFDVLGVKVERAGDSWAAHTTTVLAPLGRPIDIVRSGAGRALIMEYTRPTNFRDRLGWLPGRIIELSAATP